MSNLNKDELLQGVRNIIDEEFSSNAPASDWSNKFGIRKYINALIEEGHKNPKLMSYLMEYDRAITNGAKEFMIFEDFGNGLTTFAKGNKAVKNVIESMNKTLASYGVPLVGFQLIERLRDPQTYDLAKDTFNNYLNDKCDETKNIMYDVLENSIMNNDPAALKLNLLLTDDAAMSPNFIHEDFVSEQEQEELEERLQEQRDKKKADEIFGKVKRYLDEQFNASEKAKLQEKSDFCLNSIANNQGLNLAKHIANIKNSNASSNERLMSVIEQYNVAIQQGAYEERLYETFLHNIGKYDYLLPVDKALKKIRKTVNENKEQITLTKLLEEMKDDHSSFIYVDLIQEDVARYVKEPNAINRVQLRNALMPYASDPYINEMFNIIYSDNSLRANELQETAMNIKDQIKLIRENATVSNIYTPVQYIKENECVFNVNGQFYVKKGNNISVLDENNVNKLDERFVELCQLVNNPYVEINDDNTITLASPTKSATIYEGCVDILGHKETRESLRNLREMCMKYDDYDTNFYIMCSCLLENFNDIAKIDWAKHVELNENGNINADIFKLDNNIFLATHNETINQHTLYRNINPIFCKNKLNEHMGINVSSMFTDLLPEQDKIIMKLNETQNQYEDSIKEYEDMIEKLKEALDKTNEESNKKELQDAIDDAESKLDDLKDEYKKWQKDAESATGDLIDKKSDSDDSDDSDDNDEDGEDGEDGEVITQEPNKPIEDDEVDAVKDELSQPLDNSDNNDNNTISDEEFANILGGDNEEFPEEGGEPEEGGFGEFDEFGEPTELGDPEGGEFPEEGGESEEGEFPEEGGESEEPDIEDEEQFKEIQFPEETEKVPASTISDDTLKDEDVFGDGEEPQEPVIPDTEEYNGEDATGIFGGDTEEPIEEPVDMEEPEQPAYESDFSYKIANVMFNENLKDGTKEKSGSVIVIVPMVDGTGRKYIENQTVEFYLSEDGTPILDNEPMTNELYTAVVDAIKSHPDYSVVCETGEAPTEGRSTIDSLHQIKSDDEEDHAWEKEFMNNDYQKYDKGDEEGILPVLNNNEKDEYGEGDEDNKYVSPANDIISTEPNITEPNIGNEDDEMPNWGFEDQIEPWSDSDEDPTFGFNPDEFEDAPKEETEPNDTDKTPDEDEDIIIPTYKDGETEIEFPAANVDDTIIPESYKPRLHEKRKPFIRAEFKNKNGKRFF